MSDSSINPVGLGTAVVAGAAAGAVTPAVAAGAKKIGKKVAEKIAKDMPKTDAFIKSTAEKVSNTVDKATVKVKGVYNSAADKILGKKTMIQPDLPGLEKQTILTKAKDLLGKLGEKIKVAAKWTNEKVLTPIGKFAKKPAVAGAILFGVAYLVIAKLLKTDEQRYY